MIKKMKEKNERGNIKFLMNNSNNNLKYLTPR